MVSVANAGDQYVLRRDFDSGRWVNISGEGKTCKVRVAKSTGGEYVLKIVPQVGQKLDLKLSKENHIHFTDGFVQFPIAHSKELYGVKFSNPVLGDEFYSKTIKAVGIPRSYPRTTIGSDGHPNPVGVDNEKPKQQVAQSLPQTTKVARPETHTKLPAAHTNQPEPLVVKAVDAPSVQPYLPDAQSPSSQRQPLPTEHAPQRQHQRGHQPPAQGQSQGKTHLDSRMEYGHNQPDFGQPVPVLPAAQPPHQYRDQPRVDNLPNQIPYHTIRQAPPQAPPPDTILYAISQGAPPTDIPAVKTAKPMPIQPGFSTVQSHPNWNVHNPAQLPVNPVLQHQDQYNWSGNAGELQRWMEGVSSRQPMHQPGSASPRQQRIPPPPQPADMKGVAESLSDAMNRLDEEHALKMFRTMMAFMRESAGKCEMNFQHALKKSDISPTTFMLNIQVEFQKPTKEPILIFLYDVSPEDTINVLSSRVEHKFYIPRQAQNWIIGPKLVKGTELNKPIKEFGIVGEGVTEVNVFMYVMHTKKAQVPNEATRMRHQQFNQQQQLGRQLQAQSGASDAELLSSRHAYAAHPPESVAQRPR